MSNKLGQPKQPVRLSAGRQLDCRFGPLREFAVVIRPVVESTAEPDKPTTRSSVKSKARSTRLKWE